MRRTHPLGILPRPDLVRGEGVGATSPRITLEIRFPERPAETRSLGPGRIIFGRESGDIVLGDPETSALHAELEFTQGRVIVRDLGSRNGTWRDGKRLPQFALFPGQTFICGTTEITLQSIEGADAPAAGGTAVGARRPDTAPGQSSATLPASALAEDDKPGTIVAGGAPPPPGLAAVDRTSAAMPQPSTTLVAPVASSEAAAPAMPMAHDGSQPFVVGSVGNDPSSPMVVGFAAPGVAPAATSPAGAPRGPVANAVIKAGDSIGRKKRAPGSPGSRKRFFKILAVSMLGAGALAGIAFFIWTLVAGRNVAFFKSLADEMPQDAIGIVAVRSPQALLDLLGTELPEELVQQAKDDLGFDPFTAESYTELGIDMQAPVGVTLLDQEGVYAVSVGTNDRDKLREAIKTKVPELMGLDEDLRWIERSFQDVPGMWLDEPMPAAALFAEKRVIFVVGKDPDEVSRWAKEVADAPKGESLAKRPGFVGLADVKGKLLAAAYVDGASGRAALPGKGMEAMAMRMAFADIDGMSVELIEDGPRVHLDWQMVVREGAEMLATFETKGRDPKALLRLASPVLASFDSKVEPSQVYKAITQAASLGGGVEKAEREFREETGLDLRTDVFDNLSGEVGWALQKLPSSKEELDWAAIAWVGVGDTDAAKKAAETFYTKAGAELDIELEQSEGTTLYVSDGRFRVAFFVHEGHVWFLLAKAEADTIVKGPKKPFLTEARMPEIKKALDKGGLMAGFFDIRQLLEAARPLMSESEREREAELAPIVSALELLTIRSRLEGRSVVTELTLHTSAEQALPTIVQGLIEVAGASFAKELARKRRLDKCNQLIEHIVGLMRKELGENTMADKEAAIAEEMLTECMSDDTTIPEIDCMLAAQSTDLLSKCEGVGADDGGTPVNTEDPEPKPVPFVDDIWPNTKPVAAADGKPDPTVNYGVPAGESPAARGPDDALVTIVVFGDFECPYTQKSLGTLDEIMAQHGEYTRIVFRHNPLAMHTNARIAAKASLAAHRQGKFWQMHDKIFDNQRRITEENLRAWATEVGLDMSKYDLDYADQANETVIDTDAADAKKFGARGTPSFFVNGRFLGGTQPKHAFDRLIEEEKGRAERFVERRGNTKKRLYQDMVSHFASEIGTATKVEAVDAASEARYTIDTLDLPRKGASGYARVAIVECGDFDCPFCDRARTTVDALISDYPTVTVYWLNHPLPHHTNAEPAARAAMAAHNQGKFWEMHDKLFADKTKRTEEDFKQMARDIGLDMTQYEADFAAEATKELVEKQAKICTDNDATGTPSFFINGRLLTGAQSKETFAVTIDKELSGGI